MKKRLFITACSLLMLLGTISAQEAQLEKAFAAISGLDGFQTLTRQQLIDEGWSEDGWLSKELGDARMTTHPNADLRKQVLAILETIPGSLLYGEERDESDKISRYYTETDANGVGYFMFVFVGWGGNDTVAMIYKGRDEATYKALLDQGK